MKQSIDRDALARRLLDEAICSPHLHPLDAATILLQGLSGLGGYIASTASTQKFDLEPLPEHLNGVGTVIECLAKMAGVLIERDNFREAQA